MAWKLEDMEGGRIKVGNTVYNVVEIKYNGMVLWPMSSLYSISNVAVHYSSGNMINASGSIRASITGDVYYRNVRLVQGVNLTPTAVTGTGFSIEGNYIKGENRGTTVGPQRTGTVTAGYVTLTDGGRTMTINWTGSVTVTQQANAVESSTPSTEYEYSGTMSTSAGWEVDEAASADGDTCTIYLNNTRKITVSYVTYVYTSGDTQKTEISRSSAVIDLDNGAYFYVYQANWVHAAFYSGNEGDLSVDPNGDTDVRSAYLVLMDENNGYQPITSMTIYQGGQSDA